MSGAAVSEDNQQRKEYFSYKYLQYMIDHLQYYHVLLFGFIFKLLIRLIFTNITNILDNSVEFSTPVTSFKSLKEGLFFINNGIQLYDGGIVYHPILLLNFFKSVYFRNNEIILFLIFQIIDLVNSYLLLQINFKFLNYYDKKQQLDGEMKREKVPETIIPKKFTITFLLSMFYGINPLNILSSLSNSTIIINNFCITLTLFNIIVLENSLLATISLTTAAYLSFNPIYLLIPYMGLLMNNSKKPLSSIFLNLIYFTVSLSALLYSSYISNDKNINFLNSYKVLIVFDKINPNLGLWWYFFIEIFEFFKNFFISIFNIYSMVYILPITIRFQSLKISNYSIMSKYLICPFVLCYGFIILTKPYPNLNDLNYLFQLLVLLITQTNFKIINYLKMPTISLLLLLHSIILNPIFYYLWIYNGSGNSNFFYAINLVYALGLGSLLLDFIWGYLTMEYYFDGKNELDGTTIRLSQF